MLADVNLVNLAGRCYLNQITTPRVCPARCNLIKSRYLLRSAETEVEVLKNDTERQTAVRVCAVLAP